MSESLLRPEAKKEIKTFFVIVILGVILIREWISITNIPKFGIWINWAVTTLLILSTIEMKQSEARIVTGILLAGSSIVAALIRTEIDPSGLGRLGSGIALLLCYLFFIHLAHYGSKR